MTTDDQTLLRQYVRHRSETAFALLVERHLKLVYSTALRRVRDPHLAQDVAQSVFIELARKPWSVREPRALAGWLYRAASHGASNVLRTEARRRQRENDAMRQNATDAGTPSEWQRLEPHLDEAIHTLGATDQNVIALRFLEGKSLRETGQSLSMNEDAVQKRASRALAKLRDFFARRGIKLSVAALGTLLIANTEAEIPPWLSGAVARKALAAAASSAGITLTLMKIIAFLTTKLGLGSLAAAALVAAVVLAERESPDRHASPDSVAAQDRSASPAEPGAGATRQPARPGYRPAALSANEPSEPASAPAQARTGQVKLGGCVVDDLTGQPVTDYGLDGPGFIFSTSHHAAGRFESNFGMETGRRVEVRVLAAGYLPQPVTPEPVTVPAEITNLVVRLHRGGALQGIVFDHAGQPVAGARVFLAGNQPLELKDGKAGMFLGSTATTDAEGRFSLSGVGGAEQKVVVVSDVVQAWPVPITEPGQEMKIVLPEPATLVVRYDIPGDTEQAQIWLETASWEMPGWAGIRADTQPFVSNQFQIVLTNLAPATYDFARDKRLMAAGEFDSAFCERATLVLQSGQVQNVDWVRATGFPVTGEITGFQDAGFTAAFIKVRPAGVTGAIFDEAEGKLPTYDLVACEKDGRFQTARLSPGTYTLVAEAYRPIAPEEENEMRMRTRMAMPIGTAQVTVSADAAPGPVNIELRPPK
jgi:RNA polymerase sigma factor (sigma-70 family)